MNHDIAIVGAGIAGASLAAAIGSRARVLLLEGEDQPGYHATGRSAAFWSESYGGPAIQPLTTASHAGLAPFLAPLGSLHIGRAPDEARALVFLNEFAETGVELTRVDPRERITGLRDDWSVGVWEPSCAYIDVAALHADALVRARRTGATLVTGARLTGARHDRGWQLETTAGTFAASILVNAAGAWADVVGRLAGIAPLGIAAYRRTMVQLRTDPVVPAGTPHVAALDGSFYFKPEGQGLWLSPHDEIATDPCDAQAEEFDVALAIDRLEHAVDWRVAAVERRWAGLRSFAPDRLPVYGFAPDTPAFFWCAGQGGFGIQTAPAAAALAAALLLDDDTPFGLDPARYAVSRFTNRLSPRT